MKKFLRIFKGSWTVYGDAGKRLLNLLMWLTLVVFDVLLQLGQLQLWWAVLVGYATAALFCWTLTDHMGPGADRKSVAMQLQWGPAIRFGSLGASASAVGHFASREAFLAMLAGYGLFLALAFGVWVSELVKRMHRNASGGR